ncbi:MAG: C69 family dipeptidase [Candidatus Jordarchaeaceae archaeon]
MHVRECTAVLVGKNASATGHPIFCHIEDNGINDAVLLVYFPRNENSIRQSKVLSAEIPQSTATFAYWAILLAPGTPMSKEAMKEAPYSPWVLCGMNEYGVSIGAHGVFSKNPIRSKDEKGLSFFDVNRLVLERSKNAKEAVNLIGRLVEEYGQIGMGTNNAYCIGGPDSCWIVEVAGRIWVAKSCPSDGIIAYANQYIIESEWDLASSQMVEYAIKQKWYDPTMERFNFRVAYGKDLDTPYNSLREHRIKSLLEPKIGSITIQDVIRVTRDHFEDTEYACYSTIDKLSSSLPYQYDPHKSPYRTICIPRTQASIVCSLRSNMPPEIGNLMWVCLSSPCTSVYLPIYAGSCEVPKEYTYGRGRYSPNSAWWVFDELQRLVDDKVIDRIFVRDVWDRFEKEEFKEQKDFEKTVMRIYRKDPVSAKKLISRYTYLNLSHALGIARILVYGAFSLAQKFRI